jgi:hypothetical protein
MPESASIRLSFLPLIACVCVVVWFFRDFFEFGFDRVAGDIGDNRFIIAILEHWRHVFLGQIGPDTGFHISEVLLSGKRCARLQ